MRLAFILLATLMSACFACHPSLEPSVPRAVVTDGMVDIGGGMSLHIHCVGDGEPTVVMDAGLGNDGSVWRRIQERLVRSVRTCAYDRAGMGYSSGPAPRPHTNRQMARELRQLLERAGLHSPYVLVGHSMGGVNVRLFEAEHPAQVVGMVLVDATVDPERSRAIVPKDELGRFRDMFATLGEGIDFDMFVAGAAEMRASSLSLGDKPLVILTRSTEPEHPWASAEQSNALLRIWHEQQQSLRKLSTNAVHVVVPNTTHFIQLDAPQLVATAIEEVVDAARDRRRLKDAKLRKLASERARKPGHP